MDNVDAWGRDVFFGVPKFDDETMSYCHTSGDWMPVAFEWYKHAATLLLRIAQLGGSDGKGLAGLPHRHHVILKGLLVRSARLMFGGLRLVAEAKNGDILMALQRMSIESMVKCRWLIKKNTPELFDRFITAGLFENIELQDRIHAMAKSQGGTNNLNSRLLANLEASYVVSGVSEEDVRRTKKLPSFKQMVNDLGLDKNYFYFQSIASSQVHGDWSDLIANHLEYDYESTRFSLKSSPNIPKARVCFVGISFALATLREYISYAVSPDGAVHLVNLIVVTEDEFNTLYLRPVLDEDFKVPLQEPETAK